MKIRVINIITGVLVLFSPLSYAEIDISGYATFKAIHNANDENANYYNGLVDANETNFDTRESNIGIQFTTDISSKMDMTVVMSARGGPDQKYNFETEWAYANYKFDDDLSLRIGKVKGPFYMVSDYKDVGYAYPWVSPPEEVYKTNPIRSLNGLDLVYQKTINDVSYLAEIYYGGGTSSTYALPTAVSFTGMTPTTPVDFTTHGMIGFNASVSFDGVSFRAGYFTTKVNAMGQKNLGGEFTGLGMIIDKNNVVIYSEYIVRDTVPALSAAFPDTAAAYITAGYRMGDFLPYVTFATIGEGPDKSIFVPKQTSTALGLRYELGDATSLKFEAARKSPDSYGGDSGGLYDSAITEDAMIYTVAFDVLF